MRVGLIGCGSIGSRHATFVRSLGHDLIICDLDTDRSHTLAQKLDLSTFVDDVNALCAAQPDAVIVATPAFTHAEMAKALLAGGFSGPLFVEKPLALSVEECAVFESWPHQTMMVGYNWRFNAEAIAWTKSWPSRPFRVLLQCDTDYQLWPGSRYADPLLECSHELDLALHLYGTDVDSIAAAGKSQGDSGYQFDLASQLTEVLVDIRWNVSRPRRRFVARCGRKDHPSATVYVVEPSQASIDTSYCSEMAHFIGCAQHGIATYSPFVEGIRVVAMCEKARAVAA